MRRDSWAYRRRDGRRRKTSEPALYRPGPGRSPSKYRLLACVPSVRFARIGDAGDATSGSISEQSYRNGRLRCGSYHEIKHVGMGTVVSAPRTRHERRGFPPLGAIVAFLGKRTGARGLSGAATFASRWKARLSVGSGISRGADPTH